MNRINYPCKSVYRLVSPDQAVGAGKVFFDLWNASATSAGGSETKIIVTSIKVVVAGDVAVTGAVAANLHLHKTTAIGTSGTAATKDGTVNTAATFTSLVGDASTLSAGISARQTPTGGATIGPWLSQTSVFTEETNAGTYAEKWLHSPDSEAIAIKAGQGIKVIQGTVASVGSIGFL